MSLFLGFVNRSRGLTATDAVTLPEVAELLPQHHAMPTGPAFTLDEIERVNRADKVLKQKLILPSGYSYRWAGEYEFELRAKPRLKLIIPVVCSLSFCCCIWFSSLPLRRLC